MIKIVCVCGRGATCFTRNLAIGDEEESRLVVYDCDIWELKPNKRETFHPPPWQNN